MYQILKFENPIPSCEIHALEFDDLNQKWFFLYAVETPKELKNDEKLDLIIYEYISDLRLKNREDLHPESVNITLSSLDEYLSYLEKQRETDLKYREKWLKENPNSEPNLIKLENKNYSKDNLKKLNVNFIASIWEIDSEITTFAAI